MYRELAARPEWQRGSRARLLASLAIATLLIVTLIVTIRFAADGESSPGIEIRLVAPAEQEPPPPEGELEPLRVEATERQLPALAEMVAPAEPDAAPEQPEPVSRDWYSAMEEAAAAIAAAGQKTYSVNPAFDARRSAAAEQFRPSRAPPERPTWENVETDQLGRRILVSGDCHRVIDDPNVGSNEIFRTFGQFMVFCSNHRKPPQELPWVDEIRDRRVYLQPDPERRDAAGSELLAELR